MLGAVQVSLDCPNQASAFRVRDAINTYLAGLSAATAHKYDVASALVKGTGYRVIAGAWYVDMTDTMKVFNRVQVLWNGAFSADVLAGSQVRWHECREDEGILDCSQAPGELAVKP